jgi:hypothetical protein
MSDDNANLIKNKKTADDYFAVSGSVCNQCPQPNSSGVYGRNNSDIVSGGAPNKTRNEVQADINAYITEFANIPRTFINTSNKNEDRINEFAVTENSIFGQSGYRRVGTHVSSNSGHFTNQAIDIPVHDTINASKVINFWRDRRKGYEVIDELSNGHIHIEWNAAVEAPPTSTPVPPAGPTPTAQQTAEKEAKCKECAQAQQMRDQANARLNELETKVEEKIRQFPGLQSLFRYIEVFPEYMVASIANEADGVYANAFGASPGALSISADFSLPGIAGLRVGELFWIDRLPAFYKAFGAFQVMSIEETIGPDGWQTSVHATFNYLGKKWKEAMFKILNEGNPKILNEARRQ